LATGEFANLFVSTQLPAHTRRMAKKSEGKGRARSPSAPPKDLSANSGGFGETALPASRLRSSSLLDTRVVYCGDNLEQLAKLPDACVDLIYISEL
jgi:hypothetical protein